MSWWLVFYGCVVVVFVACGLARKTMRRRAVADPQLASLFGFKLGFKLVAGIQALTIILPILDLARHIWQWAVEDGLQQLNGLAAVAVAAIAVVVGWTAYRDLKKITID